MKTRIITAILLSSSFLNALCITHQTHFPVDGDSFCEWEVEDISTGAEGDCVIWDMSDFSVRDHSHRIRNVVLGDTLNLRFEGNGIYHYLIKGDSLFWKGYESSRTMFRDSVPMLIGAYPIEFGSQSSSPFYWHGSYCGENALAMAGNVTSICDGRGTLILPSDTLTDILRVKTTINAKVRASKWAREDTPVDTICDSLLRKEEIAYYWFSPVYRYPIARKIETSYFNQNAKIAEYSRSFLCLPEEQEYSLRPLKSRNRNVPPDSGIDSGDLGLTNDGLSTIVQDMDVRAENNSITYSFSVSRQAVVWSVITDLHGRVFASSQPQLYESGTHSNTVSANISPGKYLFCVCSGNQRTTRLVEIKN